MDPFNTWIPRHYFVGDFWKLIYFQTESNPLCTTLLWMHDHPPYNKSMKILDNTELILENKDMRAA